MITRDNYEEFFLLYADNELSSADKKMVEVFVSQNPDLKEEFSILRQSHLMPDPKVVFENKDILLKKIFSNSMINEANAEEYFLLYTDNELDKAARKDVEAFADQHPAMLESLHLLLRTRLIADTEIKFEGKEILYKKENEGVVILWPWLRITVAAMLLFLAGFFFYHFRSTSTGSIAHTNPVKINKTKNLSGNVPDQNKKEEAAVTSPGAASLDQTTGIKKNPEYKQTMGSRKLRSVHSQNPNKENISAGINEIASGNPRLIKPVLIDKSEIAVVVKPNESLGDNPLAKIPPNTLVSSVTPAATPAADHNEGINYVEQAIQKENTATADEDFFVANISPKKNKLRGLFRKVSRVFDKTTNADSDNRHGVSIGVFKSL